jgi:hypothetical protein
MKLYSDGIQEKLDQSEKSRGELTESTKKLLLVMLAY